MPSKKLKIKDHVDVRSGADLFGLNEILKKKKNNTIIVLIYADFCGHCTTFKKDVWSRLASMPNRNAGLVSIHHDQVENTPFAAKNINGYPTVFKLKKGATPKEAEEVKDNRNMDVMNTIAEGEGEEENPRDEEVEEENPRDEEVEEEAERINDLSETNENSSPPLSPESENLRNTTGKSTINKAAKLLNAATFNSTKPPVNVPNPTTDMLNSQGPSSNNIEFTSGNSKRDNKEKEKVGGSLYASLLEASKVVAPAAILTGAVVLSKKRKTKKVVKKSKRKTTKRSSRKR